MSLKSPVAERASRSRPSSVNLAPVPEIDHEDENLALPDLIQYPVAAEPVRSQALELAVERLPLCDGIPRDRPERGNEALVELLVGPKDPFEVLLRLPAQLTLIHLPAGAGGRPG